MLLLNFLSIFLLLCTVSMIIAVTAKFSVTYAGTNAVIVKIDVTFAVTAKSSDAFFN